MFPFTVPLAWAIRLLVTEAGEGAGAGAGLGAVEFCWGAAADDPPPPHELITKINKLKNNILF